jgi:hypothetical protein
VVEFRLGQSLWLSRLLAFGPVIQTFDFEIIIRYMNVKQSPLAQGKPISNFTFFFYFFQRLKSLTPMSRLYKHQKSRKNTNAVSLLPLLPFTSITSGDFTKGCRSGSDIEKCRRLALFAFLCFLNDVPIYRARFLKCPHHRVVDSKKLMERKGVRVDISVFGSSSLSPSVFTSFSLT